MGFPEVGLYKAAPRPAHGLLPGSRYTMLNEHVLDPSDRRFGVPGAVGRAWGTTAFPAR
jgi:hypothetical protein